MQKQQTTPSDPDTILFPAFLYGNLKTCRRRVKAEAKKWAKRYKEHGDFPEPKMAPVPAGSVIFCREGAVDMLEFGFTPAEPGWYNHSREVHDAPKPDRWQLHFVHELRSQMYGILTFAPPERETFDSTYEIMICRYPWGALSVAISHAFYNTIDAVSRRVEALLSFWDKLATFRYIEFGNQPVPLAQMIGFHFQGHFAMWLDAPSGDVRHDLRVYVDQMRRASDDEIRGRLVKRMRAMVEEVANLDHREWLKKPGTIEAEMSHYREMFGERYGNLTTGHNSSLMGILHYFDRRDVERE